MAEAHSPEPPAPADLSARLRALPPVQRLLELYGDGGPDAPSRERLTGVLREELDAARAALKAGAAAAPSPGALLAGARARLLAGERSHLRRVINAAGVVVHTNLGRAPLAAAALEAMGEVGRGYSNLEYDLEAGARGSRTAGVEPLLCELTGADAALAVNNAAAAVLLALAALAGGGGEVIVSRGELVEIGGGFRIPEVIAQGGARLVEVGSTNKTRLADYAAAVGERTRVILKVHPSNFRMTGFTSETGLEALAGLARERRLLLMHDQGGGALGSLGPGRPREPTVGESLRAGADLVAFSGDKLLGGPQAGLLAGRAAAVDPLRRHPLLRAVRLDKATLAALEATLRLHRDPVRAAREIPVLRMLAQSPAELEARARRVLAALGGAVRAEVTASDAYVGGGSLPGEAVESRAVALAPADPHALAARLRAGRPAVAGRLHEGRLLLDLMAVADDEAAALAAAVLAALRPGAGSALGAAGEPAG